MYLAPQNQPQVAAQQLKGETKKRETTNRNYWEKNKSSLQLCTQDTCK